MSEETDKNEIKIKSQKADEIFAKYASVLDSLSRKEAEIIKKFNNKVDGKNLENIREEIGKL